MVRLPALSLALQLPLEVLHHGLSGPLSVRVRLACLLLFPSFVERLQVRLLQPLPQVLDRSQQPFPVGHPELLAQRLLFEVE